MSFENTWLDGKISGYEARKEVLMNIIFMAWERAMDMVLERRER